MCLVMHVSYKISVSPNGSSSERGGCRLRNTELHQWSNVLPFGWVNMFSPWVQGALEFSKSRETLLLVPSL